MIDLAYLHIFGAPTVAEIAAVEWPMELWQEWRRDSGLYETLDEDYIEDNIDS